MPLPWLARMLAVLLSASVTNVRAADMGNPLAEHVRAANARFEDTSAALAEGYTAIPCLDGPDGAVIGVH